MKKYAFVLIISVLLGCCKDEPDCSTSMETKAYFEGYNTENLKLWQEIKYPLIENDTNWAHMTFVAKNIENATYYKWIIGSEEIENTPTVFRQGFPRDVPVPITLIVKKTPNKICFPKDDGIDTLTKTYYFTDKQRRWYREDGSYLYFRGSFSHKPMDSFTFYFSADRTFRINRLDTLFDYPCKGSKHLMNIVGSKYNSFQGSCGYSEDKLICPTDSIYLYNFSYAKTGNKVVITSYNGKNGVFFPERGIYDSVIFNGYQIK
jgi:hypothetical protein